MCVWSAAPREKCLPISNLLWILQGKLPNQLISKTLIILLEPLPKHFYFIWKFSKSTG
jgi:hypothetical protein